MFYTYVIRNNRNRYYIGFTSNLEIRLNWHNLGKSRYTKNRGPWKIIFTKSFDIKSEALKFENKLKSFKSRRYLEKYLNV